MAYMSTAGKAESNLDLGIVKEVVRSGITPKDAKRIILDQELWIEYCTKLDLNPLLISVLDPFSYFEVCNGKFDPTSQTVRQKYQSVCDCYPL